MKRPLTMLVVLVWVGSASAGWVMDRTTRTEGAAGPSSQETLFIAKGRVKEIHPDGTYFLWDVPRGLLFQVDPRTKTYSGGPVRKMITDVRKYLDDLRDQLSRLTDEQREELARKTEGMPMPVPPPEKPPVWTVKDTGRTAKVAGHPVQIYEIHRDGSLFEEKSLAPHIRFGDDLDYVQFATWSRELSGSFTAGMGGSAPAGKEIDDLFSRGVEMKSVLFAEKLRIVTEVGRLERQDVPDATFHLPADYILKGAQLSGGTAGKEVTSPGG